MIVIALIRDVIKARMAGKISDEEFQNLVDQIEVPSDKEDEEELFDDETELEEVE